MFFNVFICTSIFSAFLISAQSLMHLKMEFSFYLDFLDIGTSGWRTTDTSSESTLIEVPQVMIDSLWKSVFVCARLRE